MKRENELFLEALGAALKNARVSWDSAVTAGELAEVLKIAEAHRVLPMVYQAVHNCPAATAEILAPYRRGTMQMVMLQTRRTAEFLPLLQKLKDAGVQPLVVKGITCRRLYPNPDYRLSSDEDILIPAEQSEQCHQVLTQWGLRTKDPESDDYELPYSGPESALYLEIHRSLFPPESEAYGDLNRFFADIRSRAVETDGIPTLCPTDHMLYLICHAFKHFLHSGFGVRQVCDMMLFANAWGKEMDWQYILDCCLTIRAEKFAAGLFRIGEEYLGFSPELACYPDSWRKIHVETAPLLEDILQSGVYGSADRSRLHSSTITVNAVAAQKQGSKPRGLLKTVFPPAKALESRYPYLKEKPILLPIAWADRLVKYGKEARTPDNRATESIRVGKERLRLLRQYGILDQ